MKTIIESFKIKSVEPIYFNTKEERIAILDKACYNPFLIHSDDVLIDLLTDSGTSAMSSDQWAGIMKGDESYAGSPSFFVLKSGAGYHRHARGDSTHQGRAAREDPLQYTGRQRKIFYQQYLI